MGKFIKKVTAQKCPIHQGILDECGKRLVEKGYFNKASVLEQLRFTAMEDSIRWDYIADFLSDPEGDHGIEIVPLAQKFFSSTKAERMREMDGVDSRGNPMNLGIYLAGGHGKKTAGYARASFEGGLLALKRAQNYKSMRNGVGSKFEAYRIAIMRDKTELKPVVIEKLENMG